MTPALAAPGVDSFDDLTIGGSAGDPLARSAGACAYNVSSFGAMAGLVAAGTGGDAWLSTFDSEAALTGVAAAVPEPATWALWLAGLGLAIGFRPRPAPARSQRAVLLPAPRRPPGR